MKRNLAGTGGENERCRGEECVNLFGDYHTCQLLRFTRNS